MIVAYRHDTWLNMLDRLEFRIVTLIHRVKVYHNEDIRQSNETIKQLNVVLTHGQLSMKVHKRMESLNHR